MSAFSRRKLLSSFAGISISTFGVSKISNKLTASQNSGTLHIPSVSSRKFVCTIDSYSNTHISLWVNQTQSLEERHRLIAIKNLFTEKSIVSSVKGPEINSSDQSRIKVSFNFESNRIEKPVQYTIVAAPSSRINNTNSYKYLTESDPFRIENQQTISSVSLTSPSETRWPYSRNNLNGN